MRPGNPSATWRAAVARARENSAVHWSSGELEAICWRQGFGATATALLLDIYCSCHPDVLAAQERQNRESADAG